MIEPKTAEDKAKVEEAKRLIGLLVEERDAQLTFRAMALGFRKATASEVATAKRAYIEANARVVTLVPRATDALVAYFAMIEEQRRAMHLS